MSALRELLASRAARVVVALLLVAAAVVAIGVAHSSHSQHFTLYFDEAKSLYAGDSVDVLDVPVGHVTSVQPESGGVRVDVVVDGDTPIPAGARGVIVSPTLVSVRHVELTPAYTTGVRLADHAVIPLSRTAVPVEWDEVQRQLTDLATALGPKGANKDGALTRVLKASSADLGGEGPTIDDTVRAMSTALTTLADNSGHVFATVRNLRVFVHALASSDLTVRRFTRQLDLASADLASSRQALRGALTGLDQVVHQVHGLIRRHGPLTTRELGSLAKLATALSAHRQGLADILQTAPTALSNFYDTYDPSVPAMTGTFVGQNFDTPATFLCSTLYSLGSTPKTCQTVLAPVAKYLATDFPPVGISPVNDNGDGNGSRAPLYPDDPDKGTTTLGPGGLAHLMLGGSR